MNKAAAIYHAFGLKVNLTFAGALRRPIVLVMRRIAIQLRRSRRSEGRDRTNPTGINRGIFYPQKRSLWKSAMCGMCQLRALASR
jgi:hypothetical protein